MAEENNSKVEPGSQDTSRNVNQRETSMQSHSWFEKSLRVIDVKKGDKFAPILDAVGQFGTFQRRLVALTFIPNIISGFFLFVDQFVLEAQKPYCNTSWILAVGPNLSEAEQLNLTLPREPNGTFQTCRMYLPVSWDLDSIIQFGLNYTDTCQDGWIYPGAKRRSLINEFDLVCGRELYKDTMHTTFVAGLLTGCFMFGLISDKMGRYPATLLSLLVLTVFGFGTAFVNSFNLYLFFRFCASQALVGYAISSMSLVTEWLGGEHRAHGIILAHCFFDVGILFLTGLAYSIPHWRLLFLVGGLPVFPLIFYIWILPESPRWLVMKGKVKEAKELLCYAAAVNNRTIPLSLLDELQLPRKKTTTASVLDFYSNRQLCMMTLVLSVVWFTSSYGYFTLQITMKEIGVNIYLRQVVFGLMEVPARLCCIFLVDQVGRKWSLAMTLLQASLVYLVLMFIPAGPKSTMVLVIMLGQFSLAATATVFFLHTAELFPTVLRSTGLGLVTLSSVAGAMLSLTIIRHGPSILPFFLCLVSVIMALGFSSLLPESRNQPLCDSLEHFPHLRNMSKEDVSDEIPDDVSDDMSADVSPEASRNAILNAQILRLDLHPLTKTALKEFRGQEESKQEP
ncbi:solute carrier family 22 member 14 [Eulemur rufifrons]|uniref:solute carrier family 22 member 14 n=1 Tax=Eulemur rufifrons TaxID=859984 RepID=UPI00374431A7